MSCGEYTKQSGARSLEATLRCGMHHSRGVHEAAAGGYRASSTGHAIMEEYANMAEAP